jgi:uncharacterized protein (TIGR00299 family) protein
VRVAHFDCFSGISGDMVLGALIDAGVDPDAIRAGLDSLGLPIKLVVEPVKRGTFAAKHARVEAPDEHAHRHLHHIEAIINKGKLTDRQRDLALRIFRRLGEAEAAAHGKPIEKIHFHEVGALDSIADIVGSAIGLELLGVDKFTSRSVPTGTGTVQGAHGIMPVPAPGTVALLKGVPIAPSDIPFELTTPTGAAILTTVVTEWVESPRLTLDLTGHGAGTRDFPDRPNILRLLVGTATETATRSRQSMDILQLPIETLQERIRQELAVNPTESDTVWLLETNLDDVPGEVIGYTCERLMAAGALDAWTTAIQMKKQRPGVVLSVLAQEERLGELEQIMFRETGTLGVRRCRYERTKRPREESTAQTPWGPVRLKAGKPEYEDCARLARENGVPLRDVLRAIQR